MLIYDRLIFRLTKKKPFLGPELYGEKETKTRVMVNDGAVMMHTCLKGSSSSYLSANFSTRAIVHDRQTKTERYPQYSIL